MPLFGPARSCLAFLYPEACSSASWCGWVDSDMVISGSLLSHLSLSLSASPASVLSVLGLPDKLSFGPLTAVRRDAYRSRVLPYLLRSGTLLRTFSERMHTNFDEWGQTTPLGRCGQQWRDGRQTESTQYVTGGTAGKQRHVGLENGRHVGY